MERRERVTMGTRFAGKVREVSVVNADELAWVNVIFDLDESDSNIVFSIPEGVFIQLDSAMRLFKERKAKDIRSKIAVLENKAEQLKARVYSLNQQVSDLEANNG
jgi:hypothetical protein